MCRLHFSDIYPTEEVASTYTYLSELKETHPDLPSGSYVTVAYQTAGRGQRGNSWFASPGASLIPSFLISETGLKATEGWAVSEWVALSLHRAVCLFLPHSEALRIKWPNDLYYKNSKLAGILIAHTLKADTIDYSVVGVGLNVNEAHFPEEVPNPVSLYQIVGAKVPLESAEQAFKQQLIALFPLLQTAEGRAQLHENYLHNLYRLGQKGSFRDVATGEPFDGTIIGVAPSGRLLLTDSSGAERSFVFKEVAYL